MYVLQEQLVQISQHNPASSRSPQHSPELSRSLSNQHCPDPSASTSPGQTRKVGLSQTFVEFKCMYVVSNRHAVIKGAHPCLHARLHTLSHYNSTLLPLYTSSWCHQALFAPGINIYEQHRLYLKKYNLAYAKHVTRGIQ